MFLEIKMLILLKNFLNKYPKLKLKIKVFYLSNLSLLKKPKSSSRDFLFIVGSGRSGNTLLRRLLMDSFKIYIPPETYVLSNVAQYQYIVPTLHWSAVVDLVLSTFEYYPEFETFEVENLNEYALEAKGWEKSEQNIENLVFGLYEWLAKKKNIEADYFGDKTPLNTLHLPLMRLLFPNAKYIFLVRDGVDVAKSYLETGTYDKLTDAAKRWLKSNKIWEREKNKIGQRNYLEVRYEDLVSDPGKYINEIGKWLGLSQRSKIAEKDLKLGDVDLRKHHSNVKNPPNLKSIGKGRRAMTAEENKKLSKLLNRELTRLGYPEI